MNIRWQSFTKWGRSDQIVLEALLILVTTAICVGIAMSVASIVSEGCAPSGVRLGADSGLLCQKGVSFEAPLKDDDSARPAQEIAPNITLSAPRSATVRFTNLSGGDRLLANLPTLLGQLLALSVVALLWLIARSLRRGNGFSKANIAYVMGIGALIAGGGYGVQLVEGFIRLHFLGQPGVDNHVLHTVEVSLLPLAIGLLIGLLAEVFRRGYVMRQELESVI